MCIGFTNLNKVCPKDSYPLPEISKLIEFLANHELLDFIDALLRY